MKPNFSVLFCDDIRHEVGGKVSLMGIYGSHLLVPSMPLHLPKLAIHFNIELPIELKPDSIKINILIDGKQHTSMELAGIGYKDDLAEDVSCHRILGGTDINNIEFTAKSRVEAVVELDDKKAYSTCIIIDTKENYDAQLLQDAN
jgi:hypothetical protein